MHRASRGERPPLKHNTPHRGQKHQWLSCAWQSTSLWGRALGTAIFALIFKTFSLTHFTQAWQCCPPTPRVSLHSFCALLQSASTNGPNPAPPAQFIHSPSQRDTAHLENPQFLITGVGLQPVIPSSIFSPLPDHKRRRLKWRTVVLV